MSRKNRTGNNELNRETWVEQTKTKRSLNSEKSRIRNSGYAKLPPLQRKGIRGASGEVKPGGGAANTSSTRYCKRGKALIQGELTGKSGRRNAASSASDRGENKRKMANSRQFAN